MITRMLLELRGCSAPLAVSALVFGILWLFMHRNAEVLETTGGVSLYIAVIAAHALAVLPFGREFSAGTMHWLQAQPISRARLFAEKLCATLLLLAALLGLLFLFYRSVLRVLDPGQIVVTWAAVAGSGVVAVLFLRQILTSTIVSILLMVGLVTISMYLWRGLFEIEQVVEWTLGIWAVVSLALAWLRFRRLEV